MPELGFGSPVSATRVHVLPPSADQVSNTLSDRVRPTAWSRPPGCSRMLGWIASIARASGELEGNAVVHVRPSSTLRSKWMRHRLGCSLDSFLLDATTVPSGSFPPFFFIVPRNASGERVWPGPL